LQPAGGGMGSFALGDPPAGTPSTAPGMSPTPGAPNLGENGGCNKLEVKFERVIPTVAIVIDRSSSMFTAYGQAGSRWDVLKKTLLDQASGIIKTSAADLRFGLAMYTGHAKKPTCPWLEKVDFAVGNFDAINALYGAAEPPKDMGMQDKGETPTGETILQVTAELEKVKEAGPKYIVLATDGEPDTCPGTCNGNCAIGDRPGWPRDPNCGHDRSIAAVQAAFAKGIRTFVLGIGEELDKSIAVQHMQALANAGAGQAVALGMEQGNWLQYTCNVQPGAMAGKYTSAGGGTKYYKPADAAALARDLRTIFNDLRTCKFNLNGKVNPTQAPMGVVQVNGQVLKYDEGWRMNGETELEILGKSCEALQTAGVATLKVAFPCGIFRAID
jgi:hypothetical protein